METFYANTDIEPEKPVVINDKNEIIHAFASLRIKKGDTVSLINGKGSKYICRVLECSKRSLILIPLNKDSCDTEYDDIRLTLAVSVLNKNSKMKLLTEKITELGVKDIIPFVSKRTAFPKMSVRTLRSSMISALKQCGGTRDVNIFDTMSVDDLVKVEGFEEKYFADISGERVSNPNLNQKILTVIGPEGGFTNDEIDLFLNNGFKTFKLNKRVLRAETAAIVAASKFLY
ncbi:MAG: RsmE family RNA methyltransferase [Candidatus Delongbacteria bacterium]